MHRLRTLLLVGVLALLAALPATADAKKTNVRVGIADQSVAMFGHPEYRKLKLKLGRYFIRWDARKYPAELAAADAYLKEARSRHVKVLMHITSVPFAEKHPKLPSVKTYKRNVRFLIKRYRKYTGDWGTWNEVNHKTQAPSKNPKRAAQYFKAMRSMCKRCNIVALDILDQTGKERYMKRFYRALGRRYARRYAKIIGIHNYGDTNRPKRKGAGTRSLIRTAKRYGGRRPQVWMTETGGLARFGPSFPCSEKRQSKAISRMFGLAKRYRRYVKRLYVYNWQGTDCNSRFDTGLVRADGSVRPAFRTLKRNLKRFKR